MGIRKEDTYGMDETGCPPQDQAKEKVSTKTSEGGYRIYGARWFDYIDREDGTA